jgi:2-dehydro-3-deoxy-D-arabinonate dehydratase
MRIAKFLNGNDSTPQLGLVEAEGLWPLARGEKALSELFHAEDLGARLRSMKARSREPIPLAEARLLAPIDLQEVWGAGVTYERSKVARQEESEQAATFYDRVYRAARPELFFKATPSRVVGPDAPVRVRRDTAWCVPEPELALVLTPAMRIVGYTIGNDVSARDIEGENPLYLPQAKVYEACCSLGPFITLVESMPPAEEIGIRLTIERGGAIAVDESTSVARMARKFDELTSWLAVDNVFADGVVLLTGTGIVPPTGFSLQAGDIVRITIDGIGTLVNPVVQHSRLGAL